LGRFEVASHPLKPKVLVKTISSFNCLISHRLHANIIAHSLHIPSIALSWDAKVQSYCDLIGCTEWCVSDRKPIDVICKNLNSALSKGVDVKVISALKETALLNIKAQIEMGKL
jgi:polysaccharide pyruvyl transferase WcaK-like protein